MAGLHARLMLLVHPALVEALLVVVIEDRFFGGSAIKKRQMGKINNEIILLMK